MINIKDIQEEIKELELMPFLTENLAKQNNLLKQLLELKTK
jgi:hypothetical protein